MKKLFTLLTLVSIISLSVNAQEWSEDFESGSIPADWTNETDGTDDGFLVGTDLSSAYFPIPDHTTYAGTNDDDCDCDKSNDNLITSEFGIPADETYALSFAYYMTPNGIGYENASVNVSTDDGATWTELSELVAYGEWTTVNYLLSDYSGDSIQVSFSYDDEGNWGYGLILDDIEVSALQAINLEAQMVMLPEIYTTEDGSLEVSTYFMNNGSDDVTSLTLHYQVDGEDEVMDVITGLSLATFESDLIVSPTLYDAATLGDKSVNVWATLINDASSTSSNEVDAMVQITNEHTVKIGLSETFTSNTCGPCAGFNPPYQGELDDINANSGSNYVAIKYQVNWPSPGNDVCYNSDIADRISYYGINAVPTTLVEAENGDYNYGSVGTTWDEAASNVAQQFQDLSELNGWVDISTTVLWDNESDVTVDVSVTPNANFDANTQTLYVAVINEYYDNTEISPSGTNGETEWEYVVRKMLPDGEGTSLEALATGVESTFNFEYTFTIGDVDAGSYDLVNENIQVVAWVQDDANGSIRNASLGDMSLGLNEISKVNDFNVFPNPTNGITNVTMNLVQSSDVLLEVTDLLGKVVYTESMGTMVPGNHALNVDASELVNGIYFFNVYVGDQKVTQRVSVNK